jgi:CRP-like cAMP-binding protein
MEAQPGYPVSAEALESSEVLVFDSRVMLGLLRDSVDSCFNLMATMSQRLRRQINEIDTLTLHNATFRLVTFLLQQIPEDVLESPEIQLTTPKNVVASRLSIQPETFSRILARLNKRGLLEVNGLNIVLRDLPGLRKLVEL